MTDAPQYTTLPHWPNAYPASGASATLASSNRLKAMAKTAAVAIPLHYIFGSDKPESNLYCVITNWWKHRFKGGDYKLPILDNTFYGTAPILFREDLMAAEHPENVI